ncbi:MAG: hypothetical protein H7174_03690 [Flavobacterium sp.]|nr:hypothetical protein [Flavobacterium sp.]
MRKFLIKSGVLFSIFILFFFTFMNFFGGYVDYYYLKFTSKLQGSLILGDSKSFMGIQPEIMQEHLTKNQFAPMFNYGFTFGEIAYGDYYLNSIKKKLDLKTKNGLFILEVNPWVLTERETDDFKKGKFFESNLPPHNMQYVNCNPNLEYFLKNIKNTHFTTIFKRNSQLHNDGFFEDHNIPSDSISIKQAYKNREKDYVGFTKKHKISPYRIKKLAETIQFLSKHGKVVLLRLPNAPKIDSIENSFWTTFDIDMQNMATKNNAKYINYTMKPQRFSFFDGIHFDPKGSKEFTISLCDSINKIF